MGGLFGDPWKTGTATSVPLKVGADPVDRGELFSSDFGRGLLALPDAVALTALMNLFTSTLNGLVPASGGGAVNFLRADGVWAVPAGGGGGTGYADGDYGDIIASGAGTGLNIDATVLSAFGRTIIDDPDAATVRTTIGAQPLDSDLTAIAALATTSFGRGLLALADAAALRTAAALVIGTDVQAFDSDLNAIAALATTAFGRGLLTLADAAALRTAGGLVIGTDVQAFDADLASIAALATTAFGRGLLTSVDAAALRTTAGLVIGTNVQAFDADLTSIAALTTTAFGRGFLDLADAAAARTKLALGTAALSAVGDFQPIDSDLTAIAALATTTFGRSLLALADAAALRTAAGLVIGTDVQAFDSDLASIAALATTSYGRGLLTLADAAAQTAGLNVFTTALKGLVPASGGGNVNVLKPDGTWSNLIDLSGGFLFDFRMSTTIGDANFTQGGDGDTVDLNIRPKGTKKGVVSFTHDAVADRWSMGLKGSDGKFYLSADRVLANVKFTFDTDGSLLQAGKHSHAAYTNAAPADGDIWFESAKFRKRENGLTTDLDGWTYCKLAADFVCPNSVAFGDINDGTTFLRFTPPANSDWELEARILIWTTNAANLPRVGFHVVAGATAGYGAMNMWQAGATANASVHVNGTWNNPGAAVDAQQPAGGVLTATTPWLCEIEASGRSGAAPTAISIQLACEIAAATTCLAKRGSFLRYKVIG